MNNKRMNFYLGDEEREDIESIRVILAQDFPAGHRISDAFCVRYALKIASNPVKVHTKKK